jgi:hypothetical protein
MVGRKNTTAVFFICFVAGSLPARAATHEEIVESCRQSVGRPIVQACMGGRRDMLEECRQKATPAVRACVIKEEQRIAATKAAPAAPKDKEEEAALKGARSLTSRRSSTARSRIPQKSRNARRPPTRSLRKVDQRVRSHNSITSAAMHALRLRATKRP